MEKELEEQYRKNREMLNEMKAESVITTKARGDTPNWRKKKVRRIALALNNNQRKNNKEESSDYGSELPGEENPDGDDKKPPKKRNKNI
jgi:hypothetical protein